MNTTEAQVLVVDHVEWAKRKAVQLMAGNRARVLSWDIEQVALEGLVEAARDWKGDGDFKAYAWTAIRNQVIDTIRKAKRTSHFEIPMDTNVLDWLSVQDGDEWTSWDRHVSSIGSIPCERDALSPS